MFYRDTSGVSLYMAVALEIIVRNNERGGRKEGREERVKNARARPRETFYTTCRFIANAVRFAHAARTDETEWQGNGEH